MADDRDEIRQRIDLVDLVSQQVKLKRSGKNYSGLCPFHDDKSPSFYVSPTTGRYRCFSCGETGDVFNWVMKTQGLEFREALKLLAEKAGVTLKARSEPVDRTDRDRQLSIMHSALLFFQNELKKSASAKHYLDSRQISSEQVAHWELGYAPEHGEALVAHLKKQGTSLAEAKELFLVDTDSNGGFFDKFRGRLMFPIRDERGAVLGFGGRIMGQGNPKYINSSDTPLYSKSRVLFGLNHAKDKMMKSRHVVLTEGYLDVIACHEAGVTEAVASCGTSLAEDQAKLMKRFADRVTILYDGDEAGRKAANRALEVFAEAELPARVVLLPVGDDPDSLLKRSGPTAVQEAIQNSQSPFDFKVQMLEWKLTLASEEFWNEIPTLLASAPSELDVEKHIMRLGGMHPTIKDTAVVTNALRRQVRQLRTRGRTKRAVSVGEIATSIKSLSPGEAILLRSILDPELCSKFWKYLYTSDLFFSSSGERIQELLFEKFGESGPTGPVAGWISQIGTETDQQLLADLDLDLRVQSLSEDYVKEAVQNLQESRERRALSQARPSEATASDEDLRAYLDRIKRMKGDPDSSG